MSKPWTEQQPESEVQKLCIATYGRPYHFNQGYSGIKMDENGVKYKLLNMRGTSDLLRVDVVEPVRDVEFSFGPKSHNWKTTTARGAEPVAERCGNPICMACTTREERYEYLTALAQRIAAEDGSVLPENLAAMLASIQQELAAEEQAQWIAEYELEAASEPANSGQIDNS